MERSEVGGIAAWVCTSEADDVLPDHLAREQASDATSWLCCGRPVAHRIFCPVLGVRDRIVSYADGLIAPPDAASDDSGTVEALSALVLGKSWCPHSRLAWAELGEVASALGTEGVASAVRLAWLDLVVDDDRFAAMCAGLEPYDGAVPAVAFVARCGGVVELHPGKTLRVERGLLVGHLCARDLADVVRFVLQRRGGQPAAAAAAAAKEGVTQAAERAKPLRLW